MPTTSVNVHEELAEAPVRAFHWRLCTMIGLLVFFDGYDTFNPAYVIHYVAVPWGLNPVHPDPWFSAGLSAFCWEQRSMGPLLTALDDASPYWAACGSQASLR